MIRDHGLAVVPLCRGGFFPSATPAGRAQAIDESRRFIDEAAALCAPFVVLVCGAEPSQPLGESHRQIAEGLAAVLPHAATAKVKLAIEPLHHVYAGDRSAVNTTGQARSLCRQLEPPSLDIASGVYHVWWDDRLEEEINACGHKGILFALHIYDCRTPTYAAHGH